jgi:UDP-hydrolysing UDP-N-acetyl-D-glucosamine 2-epimerase
MKRKICVVLTARASYAKIKPIIQNLQNRPDIELQIICAASAVLDRFGNTIEMVKADGFTVNESIHFLIEGEDLLTTTKSTGLGLVEFAGAFNRLKPHVVLVMADRYEVLSAAIAASFQNIPLAHVQGGEVSGNIDEKVRHAVTKLADLHFPATERARDWIVRMGEDPSRVFLSGCPSIDLAKAAVDSPELGFDLYKKYGGVGARPPLDNGYIIVMQHAVTTEPEQSRTHVNETLLAVNDIESTILWFWPNPDAGSDDVSKAIRAFRENHNPKHIHFIKNMAPQDFLKLLHNSEGIIGNSSAAIREASFFGVPAINIGSRQENRERGFNVVDVPYDHIEIKNAAKDHFNGRKPPSFLYGDGNAGKKIADILAKTPLTYYKEINYLQTMN